MLQEELDKLGATGAKLAGRLIELSQVNSEALYELIQIRGVGMTKEQALKLAIAYVNERRLIVGNLKAVRLMPMKARPEAAPKGDLWQISFKDPTIPSDVIQDPDVIVIHVEDSTGETSEFYAM